jgi:hemerythrin-like domain-containing protein
MKATQQLQDEHQGVYLMLHISQKASKKLIAESILNQEHFEGMLDFFKVFVDRCHHAKEEYLLFPALEAAGVPRQGVPIGTLLDEHEKARGCIRAMSDAFSDYRQGSAAAFGCFG